MNGVNWSMLDAERECARCKQAKAVVLFDREQLCAACARAAEEKLLKEASRAGRQTAARTR